MTAPTVVRLGRRGAAVVVAILIASATLIAVAPVGAQESTESTSQDPMIEPPKGIYEGVVSMMANVWGPSKDGISLKYRGSYEGPASILIIEDGSAAFGDWESTGNGEITFSGVSSGIATFTTESSGDFFGDNRVMEMNGVETGASDIRIETAGVVYEQSNVLEPYVMGPWNVTFALVSCNIVWADFTPDLDNLAEGLGWTEGWIDGSLFLIRVDDGDEESERSAEAEALQNAVVEANDGVKEWIASSQASVDAGEQPDISGLQDALALAELANSKLDEITKCDSDLDPAKFNEWRTQFSKAIQSHLEQLLGSSPGTITFTSQTLNDMATVAGRSAAIGEGASVPDSAGLAAAIESAAADTASAGDDPGLERLDRRMGWTNDGE